MYDQPPVSMRTRWVIVAIAVFVLLQGAIVSMFSIDPTLFASSVLLSVLAYTLAAMMMVWMASRVRGSLAPRRESASITIAGGVLRACALIPLTLSDPVATGGLLDSRSIALLIIAYVLLFVGFGRMVIDTTRGISLKLPILISVGCGAAIFIAFSLATYAPIRDVPTILTARDRFAFWLLAADMGLATLTSIVALASLSRENGVLAKPWLWLVGGQLICAGGDAVQPLLGLEDMALFTALLWSLGYALIAAAASLLVDVLEWRAEHPKRKQPLLYRREHTPSGRALWDRQADQR